MNQMHVDNETDTGILQTILYHNKQTWLIVLLCLDLEKTLL